jgi:hypothetical protein
LAKLIKDVRPDVVINMGDQWDMASLSSFDKGKKSFQGRNYRKDVEAGLEFSDRLWGPVKRSKKKLPRRIFLEGNHEERIRRAIETSPELDGAISYQDLDLRTHYGDDIVYYNGNTPGITTVDGIHYAHFFVSGVMGRPIGGEHPAYQLLTKEFVSCTSGHVHVLDYCERTTVGGTKIHGLVAGVFQDYDSGWAGEVNKLWWRGVVLKRHVEDGGYDPQFISLESLRKEYG